MSTTTNFLDVGFHDSAPAAIYHGDPTPTPSLSSSLAVDLINRSPAHARLNHPRLTPNTSGKKETAGMSFGSVMHELLLGKGGGFSVWEGSDWRGKAAGEFWDTAIASGKSPIKQADYDRAKEAVKSVRGQLASWDLEYVLHEGVSEHVAIWQDRGQYMRSMFDKHIPERREIWDIKTTETNIHPEKISRHIANMDYDMRSEFYLMGAEKLTGIPARKGGYGYCFLFIEVQPPFSVVPCYLDEAFRTRGKLNANRAIDTWARCMETGFWPGFVNKPVEIAAPGWVDYEIEETGISSSGAKIA